MESGVQADILVCRTEHELPGIYEENWLFFVMLKKKL